MFDNRAEMERAIRLALAFRGRNWVRAAMVEGSIGYHTPKHADRLIDDFLRGEQKCYCERAMALYGEDLIRLMAADVWSFERMDDLRRAKVIQAVDLVATKDSESQDLIGLAWPTMGI